MPNPTRLRLLVVEDSDRRVQFFEAVIGGAPKALQARGYPGHVVFRVVYAHSAGAALGILRRDRGRTYAGILLDHDLTAHHYTPQDRQLTGKDVAAGVIAHVDRRVPILVHSANMNEAPMMVSALERAGFAVERVAFTQLEPNVLLDWLEYVVQAAQ